MRVVALLLLITTCFLWHANAQNPICPGNQIWSDCGSACNSTCDNPYPICTLQCVPRCECPSGAPIWHNDQCVQQNECPVSLYPDYPYCCPEDKDTWCFTCSAPTDNCCIAIGMIQKCNPGETCAHYTDAKGHSHRGCVPHATCPDPPVQCAEGQKLCKECLCDDPKFNIDVQDRIVSQCEDPGYEYPWCLAWCYGDPHIGTCDKRRYPLNAVDCSHVFIRSNCTDGQPDNDSPSLSVISFLGRVVDRIRGAIDKAVKIIRRILSKVYVIWLGDNLGYCRINGIHILVAVWPNKTHIDGAIILTYFESLNILRIDFVNDGFRIYWDFRGGLGVWIPNQLEFKGHMCGLAGDCDGNPDNDLQYGPSVNVDGGCPALSPGSHPFAPGDHASTTQMEKFGMSWYYNNTGSQVCNAVCYQSNPIMGG